ncbi:MAG: HD domain-containing protein [Cyclobacteriaceae bacterium]|nr:HD domain-containing protein [Cyclobacteriaceae bacterium]
MNNFNTPLLRKTKEYVAGFIAENFTEKICYHNIDHTLEVVEAVEIIGKHCNISKEDMEAVIIAAWFHDTGYFLGCENHEEASANIAKQFLFDENVDPNIINKVANCILSTKIPQTPKNTLEKIICDADLFHLASEKFFNKSELLWRELTLHNHKITPECWLNKSKEFVEAHEYHTTFGKEILLPKMEKNLALLKLKIKEYEI